MLSLPSVLLQYIISQHGIVHDPQLLNFFNKLKYQSSIIDESNVKNLKKELDESIAELNIQLDPLEYKIVKYRQYTPFPNGTMSQQQEQPVEWSNMYYCYVNCINSEVVSLATEFKPVELLFVKYVVKELSQPNITKNESIRSFLNNSVSRKEPVLKYKYAIDRRLHLACSDQKSHEDDDNSNDDDDDARTENSNSCFNQPLFADYLDHSSDECKSQVITFRIPTTKLINNYKNFLNDSVSPESNVSASTTLKIADQERIINNLCEKKWLYKDSLNRVGLNLKSLIELKDLLYSTGPNESEEPFQCEVCKKIVTIAGINCNHCNEFTLDVDCLKQYVNKCKNGLRCAKCQHPLKTTADILYIL